MPWTTHTAMSLRLDFVRLAEHAAATGGVAALCRAFGVSRKTGYKWLARYREGGEDALADRPRTPRRSPGRTPPEVEAAVLRLRDEHPAWGGRKIRAVLLREGEPAPAPATVTAILRRHGRLSAEPAPRPAAVGRFEAAAPNELWQMDFKGDFALTGGGRCYPLTALDDHSRFALCLAACSDQRRPTVQGHLTALFREHGLPRRLLCDNGPPWGSACPLDERHARGRRYTRLAAWLIRLGITVVHGRPAHPQTQGKEERFHRTLSEEVLAQELPWDLADCQGRFDCWRALYNTYRPHEALGLAVPASRYAPSERAYPERLPPVEYAASDEVRRVDVQGRIAFRGRAWRVGKGLAGERVALREGETDGAWSVYLCHQRVGWIDLRAPRSAS